MVHLPNNTKELYNESDWSDVKACNAYYKSKTLAEKAAWDFLETLPLSDKFELVTINPSLILGPSFIQTDFTSGSMLKKMLMGAFPALPKILMPIVDVRDVA